jgi:hypothetical protein
VTTFAPLFDGREHFTGCRIERLELLPRGGVDQFAVDQHFLVGTIRIGMTMIELPVSQPCSSPCRQAFWHRYISQFTTMTWNRKAIAPMPAMLAMTKARSAASSTEREQQRRADRRAPAGNRIEPLGGPIAEAWWS